MRFRGTAEAIAVGGAIALSVALFAYVRGQETDEIGVEYGQTENVRTEENRSDLTPTPEFVSSRRTFVPWLTLFGGLTITALLAAHLGAARKRTKEIERLVDERTAQLKVSERNLKTVLDETMDCIITTDSHGMIEFANLAAQNMFGFRAEELVGHNVRLLMPEPYHSEHSSYISEYLRSGDAKIIGKSLELDASRKDGSEFPIRLSVNEYQIDGIQKFVGTVQDLSEYKQMLETLSVRNDAIETSSDGISIADLSGDIVYANSSMLRMWGFDRPEEVLGGSSYPHWDSEKEARRVAKAMETTGSWSGEILAKRKDGSTFPVALSAHMATDKSGRPLCFMASCRDITERKKTEQELANYREHLQGLVDERTNELQEANELLRREIAERRRSEEAVRESEAQLRLMADSIPALIMYVDADRRYQFNNAVYAEWFNMPTEECVGKYVWEIIGETTYEEIREHIDEALRGRQVSFEQKLPLPDGAIRHVQVNYVPHMDSEGKVQGFFALATDVTAQKNMEARHRQAQRLEALGTLAGGIAHDFNNLLGAIIGFTSMAREDTGEDTELREDLDEVLSAANRARDLVAQILTFSRQTKENHAPVLLYPILEESIRLIEAVIPASIKITTAIDRECDAVMGDASQIHQVIMNLLTNAYHAMKARGGELHVALDQVYVDAELVAREPDLSEGPYALVTVKDMGHGIPQEELERIYDPFFTTKETGEGTGLGLSTAHGIVQVHGGAIMAQSEVGKGTTFSVYLPSTHETESVESPPEDSAPGGSESILVVEDEAMLLRFAERSLSKLGYRVTAFQSSLEALDEFRARPQSFDLIISDLNMPHMDGAAFAREALRTREDVPIVLVTGYSETLDAAAATRLGVRQMLSKPYTAQVLAKAVRNAIGTPGD